MNITLWLDFTIHTTAGELREKTLEEIIHERYMVDDLIHYHKEK